MTRFVAFMLLTSAMTAISLPVLASASSLTSCKSFPGKTDVVLVTVNIDFEMMFKNWLFHAGKFLTSSHQLVVWPEDEEILDRLQMFAASSSTPFVIAQSQQSDSRKTSFLQRKTRGFSNYTWDFGSIGYRKLVSQRPHRIQHFLHEGCNVLYVDVDTVWMRSPFDQIGAAGNYDLYVTSDTHEGSLDSRVLCSCFLYMRPTSVVQQLVSHWSALLPVGQPATNQPAFNTAFEEFRRANTDSATCLPIDQFPNGQEASKYKDPTVFHANYMQGVGTKSNWFKDKGLWFM